MKPIVLALMLLARPAMAEDIPVETVTVNGSSLIGVWHGNLAQFQFWHGILGALTRINPPTFGQMEDAFCRIAPQKGELEMSCLQIGDAGKVTFDGSHVRIGGSRTAFEGEQPDSFTFAATFAACHGWA